MERAGAKPRSLKQRTAGSRQRLSWLGGHRVPFAYDNYEVLRIAEVIDCTCMWSAFTNTVTFLRLFLHTVTGPYKVNGNYIHVHVYMYKTFDHSDHFTLYTAICYSHEPIAIPSRDSQSHNIAQHHHMAVTHTHAHAHTHLPLILVSFLS